MKTKIILLTSFLFFLANANAQLPIVYATGGEGRNIDWQQIEKDYEKVEPDGPGYFGSDCDQGVNSLWATSSLKPMDGISYNVGNLNDGNPKTAWIEGKSDYGIGEYFQLKGYGSLGVNIIYNGYQASAQIWKDNSRVKKFKVYRNNKPLCFLILKDEMGKQYFELPATKNYVFGNDPVLKFEIMQVYPGKKYKDVAITEIDYEGCCFAENTQITFEDAAYPIATIKENERINTLNIETGELSETEILKISEVEHNNLVQIKTSTKTITITKDHPLYVKGFGFISIERLLSKLNLKTNADLIDKVEFLIWDEAKKTTVYEPLTHIKIVKKPMNTFSIRALKTGTSYIANGFVTTTY